MHNRMIPSTESLLKHQYRSNKLFGVKTFNQNTSYYRETIGHHNLRKSEYDMSYCSNIPMGSVEPQNYAWRHEYDISDGPPPSAKFLFSLYRHVTLFIQAAILDYATHYNCLVPPLTLSHRISSAAEPNEQKAHICQRFRAEKLN